LLQREWLDGDDVPSLTHPDFAKSLVGPLFACGGKRVVEY
jgi:hypothetical protein